MVSDMRFDEVNILKSHSSALKDLKQETAEIADFGARHFVEHWL